MQIATCKPKLYKIKICAMAEKIIIRKYANRRLYNTQISSYVTLDDLYQMVRNGEDFEVKDAKTGDDLTQSVLTQIIFEQEAKGENLLPTDFLKSIIGFYDDGLKNVVPVYLNSMMEAFAQNQQEMRDKLENTDVLNPFAQVNDVYKNVWENQQEMFSKSMELFTNFNPMINKKDDDEKK